MKEIRQQKIIQALKNKESLEVGKLSKMLNVSEMTIRRDLDELDKQGLIKRLHGGAVLTQQGDDGFHELSHLTKKSLNPDLKVEVAEKIANQIEEEELVFLGAGTTIELVADYIESKKLKIVTNSLSLFLKLIKQENKEVILIGGHFREKTNSFVGSLANASLESLRVQKAFIGVNAIDENIITNYNEEEGLTQKYILDNATIKYIVADHSKLDKVDFYHFYDLDKVDYLILDNQVSSAELQKYHKLVTII